MINCKRVLISNELRKGIFLTKWSFATRLKSLLVKQEQNKKYFEKKNHKTVFHRLIGSLWANIVVITIT